MKNQQQQQIYLITDTHFNHGEKLEKWGDRTGDWEDQIWKGLEALGEKDVLIHLGDICIGEDASVHERLKTLKCRRVLIKGNHDNKSTNWYLNNGWDFVADGLELQFMGRYLHLTHRPSPPSGHNTWNIHGHTHGNQHRSEEYIAFYSPEYHIDISPEIRGYNPIKLETLIQKYK